MDGLKITAGLTFLPHQMRVTSNGVEFDDEWKNRLYDVEEFFRSKVILPINEFAGNNWKAQFIEMGLTEKTYIVDIIATIPENYDRIALQIIEALPDYRFSFYNRGDIWRYGRPNPSPFRNHPLPIRQQD
jgi:hypothetical protein